MIFVCILLRGVTTVVLLRFWRTFNAVEILVLAALPSAINVILALLELTNLYSMAEYAGKPAHLTKIEDEPSEPEGGAQDRSRSFD